MGRSKGKKKDVEKLTPYQGRKRCYGYFKCDCGNSWESGNSWANTSQRCKKCPQNVYPFKQKPLEKATDRPDPKRKHPTCPMCVKLGEPCKNFYEVDKYHVR